MLSSSGDIGAGVMNQAGDSEFPGLLNDLVAPDGKTEPLDLAALEELGIQELDDLLELTKLDLKSDSPELKQLSVLSLLAKTPESQLENAELFGNPEINTSLASDLINNEQADNGLLIAKDINKTGLLKANAIVADIQQQSVLGKNTDLSQVLDDINLSQFSKDIDKTDIDISNELFVQFGRQESNTTKLVDQLTSMDKSVNPIHQLNTQSLKSYSGLEQTGKYAQRIEVPVSQPGWGDAVGSRLMMMVNGKIQSANIHLNPAELGPIEIRVNVNHDQATVHFVSNNSTVRNAIEDAFPHLKEMFSQNGLSLADANVSQQSSQQSSQQREQINDDQNGLMMSSNNEIQESVDTLGTNIVDIGLINQYV